MESPLQSRVSMLFSAFGVATAIAGGVSAASLDVNSPAPKLSIAEWVQGDPVDLQKEAGKRVVMVEFWAVWCPPCKESVPLLTKLQSKFKDQLLVVGVTAPDSRGNSPSAIRKFVKDQAANMTYHVGIDDRDATTDAYMGAAEAVGIPHAFLVGKDVKIAWHGSPLDDKLESVIEGLTRGTYDPKTEAEVDRRFQQLERAIMRGQWETVRTGLTEILKISPANSQAMRMLWQTLVLEMNKPEEFRSWSREHIQRNRSNARVMSVLAANCLEAPATAGQFPDVTLDAALAAYEGARPKDASTVSLYARALHQVGALDRAIALQREAVDLAQGDEKKEAQAFYDFLKLCKEVQAKLP